MARRRRRPHRGRGHPVRKGNLPAALRVWTRRLAFILLILTAGSLIAIDRTDSPVTREIRSAVADAFVPVIETVSAPIGAVADWIDTFETSATVRERNAELAREVERLRYALRDRAALAEENRRLRALLNAGRRIEGRHLTTAVIADTGGPYVRSLLVRAGSADGVRRGMAAIDANGLIGRIVAVGRRASRVLLVTDLNSRIPVKLAASGLRALLVGTNGRLMRLNYVPPNVNVPVGARIVTSGHGGVLPRGIPVGRVESVGRDTILVRPLVNWDRLTFVRLLDSRTPGLVDISPGRTGLQEVGRRPDAP